MSIIKDGKNYGVETKIQVDDTFKEKFLSHTLEEVEYDEPLEYGRWLFSKQYNLKKANIKLPFPAHPYAYQGMFSECNLLTEAPDLPATQLQEQCYANMFFGCTSLTEAPDLPATTLAVGCYNEMFLGCNSLEKTGIIAAEGNLENYTNNMFFNCPSLQEMTWTSATPPTIPSNIWQNCPDDMIIYVPFQSVDKYKTASIWSQRADYIKPISTPIELKLINFTPDTIKSYKESVFIECDFEATLEDGTIINFTMPFYFNIGQNTGNEPITRHLNIDYYGFHFEIDIIQTANDERTFSVTKPDDVDYGFIENENGFWESTNKNIDNSFSYAVVTFVAGQPTFTFEVINYGENSYDYGIMSELNTELRKENNNEEGRYNFRTSSSPDIQIATYEGLTVGETYFITIKYIKDGSTSGGNDTFQFRPKE